MQIRINKYLALSGIASRRKSDEIIANGEVTVNGKPATIGQVVDPETDVILFHNKPINAPQEFVYIALNKPLEVVSTTSDDRGRKTVLDYVPLKERLYPVGRLDYDSTGLILLTNDGELALKISHPRYHLAKKYYVKVKENLNPLQIAKLTKGIRIRGIKTTPTEVKKFSEREFQITMYQGMKRQIRKMCELIGLTVVKLHRTDIGPINIGKLKSGEFRYLSKPEKAQLLKSTL